MRQLTMADSMFVFTERPNGTSNHTGTVMVFDPSTADEPMTFDKLVDHYRQRVALASAHREKLVRVPLDLDYPYWVNDKDFDLEFHVRHSSLPRPGTRKQFFNLVSRLMSLPLDMSRPLWETYYIEGIDQVEGIPPGSFALLMKMHHASLDGVSGMAMTSALFGSDEDAEAAMPKQPWKGEDAPDPRLLMLKGIRSNWGGPFKMTRALMQALPAMTDNRRRERSGEIVKPPKAKAPKTRFNGPVTPHRALEGRVWDFAEFKRVKDAIPGVTLNDVVLTVVAGSLRRYLESKQELPKQSLVGSVPISMRSEDQTTTGGNQVMIAFIPLHTDIADPRERVAAISASMRQVKDYNKATDASSLAKTSEAMPGMLLGLAVRALSVLPPDAMLVTNTVITNVPGSNLPLFLCGARYVAGFTSGPSQDGAGLFHGVTSLGGRLSISFNADRSMMPDPEFYAQCIEDSFNELRDAVQPTAAEPSAVKQLTVEQPAVEIAPPAQAPVKVRAPRKPASRVPRPAQRQPKGPAGAN